MKKLSEEQESELNKYMEVFIKGTTGTPGVYGHKNWGKGSYDYITNIKPKSILDIGCGKGVFVNDMQQLLQIPKVYGLDIASVRTGKHIQNDKITWLDSQAHDIPLPDASVEYITSFDCLEHVLEEDVATIVNEFHRVCTKGLILRIAYHQAEERTFGGEVLHMTVRPEDWWIGMFKNKFTFAGKHNTNYLIFNK
jgi:ubiquinone/menaquinone biosynthesis C-methylase UbiE